MKYVYKFIKNFLWITFWLTLEAILVMGAIGIGMLLNPVAAIVLGVSIVVASFLVLVEWMDNHGV
jgi:hypothetical protein